MKRSFALFCVFALLIASLTACGCSASQQDDTAQNGSSAQGDTDSQNGSSSQEDTGSQNGSAVIGGDTATDHSETQNDAGNGSTGGSLEEGTDDIRDSIDNAVDDITDQDNASGGVSYEQMLRNGQVKNSSLAKDGTASGK